MAKTWPLYSNHQSCQIKTDLPIVIFRKTKLTNIWISYNERTFEINSVSACSDQRHSFHNIPRFISDRAGAEFLLLNYKLFGVANYQKGNKIKRNSERLKPHHWRQIYLTFSVDISIILAFRSQLKLR